MMAKDAITSLTKYLVYIKRLQFFRALFDISELIVFFNIK
jgi:hypothetical protein